jgi:hypothetical protein
MGAAQTLTGDCDIECRHLKNLSTMHANNTMPTGPTQWPSWMRYLPPTEPPPALPATIHSGPAGPECYLGGNCNEYGIRVVLVHF